MAAFLFDLDGVLIDSEREYTRIWREVNELWPTGVENFEHIIKGTTLYEILHKYFPTDKVRKQIMQYCIEREEQMHFTMCEGADSLLNNLSERNIKSVVVTSSDKAKMNRLYRCIPDFEKRFAAIIDGDMVHHSKPNPEGYLMAASLAGCNPRNCVVLEDSLTGIRAGHNADALVVGIAGTFPIESIAAETPDVIVNSLTELNLDSLIESVNNR